MRTLAGPDASIAFTNLSNATSASLSAAFTNPNPPTTTTSDSASPAAAQAQVQHQCFHDFIFGTFKMLYNVVQCCTTNKTLKVATLTSQV